MTGWKRLAWWWNQQWGTLTRRDVWLEHDPDTGVFRLRWRLGQYSDMEARYFEVKPLLELLGRVLGDQQSYWKEQIYLDANGDLWDYERPADAEKVIRGYLTLDQPLTPQ